VWLGFATFLVDDGTHLAEALGLDMADWWRPKEANFLGQVTKAEIVRAVSEGVSSLEGRRLTDLKKGEMVARSETLLASSRWLPRPYASPALRTLAGIPFYEYVI